MPFFSPFGGDTPTGNWGKSGQGTSAQAFSEFGSAANDLFGAFAMSDKIKGDELEAQSYDEAAQLALQNEQATKISTAIQAGQSERELYMSFGKTKAEVAGAGLNLSGSALDILRSSASQGALQTAVINQQGLQTEAGYAEQAQSYENMANAANAAVKGDELGQVGDFVAGGISAMAGIAAL